MNYYKMTICLMLLALNSQAQELVKFNETGVSKTAEDKLITIKLPFEILDGYHIQSESESIDGSLPTEIVFEDSDLFEVVSYEYSKKLTEEVILDGSKHNVLKDVFEVTVTLKLHVNVLKSKLIGHLFYQACTNKQCLFPRTLDFNVPIT